MGAGLEGGGRDLHHVCKTPHFCRVPLLFCPDMYDEYKYTLNATIRASRAISVHLLDKGDPLNERAQLVFVLEHWLINGMFLKNRVPLE